jgi:hypothetical protein
MGLNDGFAVEKASQKDYMLEFTMKSVPLSVWMRLRIIRAFIRGQPFPCPANHKKRGRIAPAAFFFANPASLTRSTSKGRPG